MNCAECGKLLYKTKPDHYTCKKCGKVLCLKHAFFYVDESNASITKNSKIYCKSCYDEMYNSNSPSARLTNAILKAAERLRKRSE